MGKRKRFIGDWLARGRRDLAGLDRTYDICRKTGHKCAQRFLAAGRRLRNRLHTRRDRTGRGPVALQAALEGANVLSITSVRRMAATGPCDDPSSAQPMRNPNAPRQSRSTDSAVAPVHFRIGSSHCIQHCLQVSSASAHWPPPGTFQPCSNKSI